MKSAQNPEFGDRVVFGEIFALLAFLIAVFFTIDSLVDFFPEASTGEIVANFVTSGREIDSGEYTVIKTILPFITATIIFSFLFTLTLLFYIINSDRITDIRSIRIPRQDGAADNPNTSGAPTYKLESTMNKNQTTSTPLPSSEVIALNFETTTGAVNFEFNREKLLAAHERLKMQAQQAGMSLSDFCEAEVYRRNNLPLPPRSDGTEAKLLLESLLRD